MRFADWRIGAKLGAGFAVMVLLCLALGSVAWWQLAQMREKSAHLAFKSLPAQHHLQTLHAEYARVNRYIQLILDSEYYFTGDNLAVQVQRRLEVISGHMQALQGLLDDASVLDAWAQYEANREQFRHIEQRMLEDMRRQDEETRAAGLVLAQPQGEPARALQKEAAGRVHAVIDSIRQLMLLQKDVVAREGRQEQRHYRMARNWIGGMMAAVLAVAALLGWLMLRAVAWPVRQAALLAHNVVAGELHTPVPLPSAHDEMGQMLTALEAMRCKLLMLVAAMRANAHSVEQAAGEMAQGSQDLAQRTETQASALEQAAALMRQLEATVRENAASARDAYALAVSSAQTTGRAEKVAQDMVQTMQKIRADSHRIADITKVVDAIALQTNILALNAAVEAARAGEHGRGFAVVAAEVQTLAQRSSDSAQEIRRLVADSNQLVAEGAENVDRAGETFAALVGSARHISAILEKISSASAQQSDSVAQVHAAMEHIEKTTHKNAAMAEENTAAAHALQQRAQGMAESVAAFHIQSAQERPDNIVPDAAHPPPPPPQGAPGEEDDTEGGRWGHF